MAVSWESWGMVFLMNEVRGRVELIEEEKEFENDGDCVLVSK